VSLVLAALDWLLTALHVAVIAAFVLLWIPRSTARIHGYVVLLTSFSWLVLGWVHGIGYCALTDLQWRVKHARGAHGLPGSFIKYAVDAVTGLDVSPKLVNAVAGVVFVLGCAAALFRYAQRRREVR
jgi:hypothetical protein